ncbi:hypothetical protein C0991_002229 [Blastosporella zonata]|nr:hypothetical protein C0991_002229 [Blastosporella zonata]
MSTAYGDNNTLIGDDHLDTSKPSGNKASPRRVADGYGKSSQPKPANDFVATTDYALEDRPFFVPILKDGLIAALDKLDKQLVQGTKLLPEDWD